MTSRDSVHGQLAGLAALESTVRLAVRVLYATYPDLNHNLRDDERIELTTACTLVQLAEDLLLALDDHRSYVLYKLAELGNPKQTAWPF